MQKKMNLIQKFKAKTPAKNKKRGILWTAAATALGVAGAIATGPIGIILLAGASFAGTMAGIHGAKVKK